MRDGGALTDLSEDVDTRLSAETKAACRRVIVNWRVAQGPHDPSEQIKADVEELMWALGIHPAQIEEEEDIVMSPLAAPLTP